MERISSGVMGFRFYMGVLAASAIPAEGADVRQAPLSPRAIAGMEADSNRFGSDYRGFDAPSAQLCQTACTNDAACRAWTWVKPGIQGPVAKCYLKNAVPARTANACCVSGLGAPVPSTAVARTPHPAIPSAPNQIIVPGAAISPAQLDFGTVWDGDVQTRTVEMAPPAIAPDGPVRVEIEPSKIFTIAEVRVLGPVGEGNRVPTDNRNVGPGGQAMLTHDRTRSRTPGAPVVDVTMRRGDTLAIAVQSAPQMNQLRAGIFDGTGPQHAQLKVAAQGWRASVPVSAAVGGEGLKATVTATPICAPYGYRPGVSERHALLIALESWRPTGIAGQAQLLQAPGGLTEDPNRRFIDYRLGPKARAQMELPYLIYWEGVRFPRTPDDSGATSIAGRGTVKIAYASASSVVVPFEVVLKPYSRNFHLKGNDGLEWQVDYTIRCDGHFELSWHFFNPNVAVRRDYTFDVMWRGQRLYRGGGYVGRAASDKNQVPAIGSDFVRDNYELMLREPPTVRVQHKNKA